jgi:hypothetical protein
VEGGELEVEEVGDRPAFLALGGILEWRTVAVVGRYEGPLAGDEANVVMIRVDERVRAGGASAGVLSFTLS